MDVKSAFLNGIVNEEIYVSQPPGFEDHKHPEYGLKQASRQWYERLSLFLLSHEYESGKVDKTLFIKKAGTDIILVQIYVDDIVFGSCNVKLCEDFVKAMQGEFEMSMMGEFSFFLGLQVKQSKEGIFVCQSKYCKDILKKFKMEACKAATTPMSTNSYLGADEVGLEVNQTMYMGLIGSLLYLTASRSDIMFFVCLCARFQSCPKESHLKAAKRILKYLKGTICMGLWYPSHSPIHLVGYSDSDFAGCKLDCVPYGPRALTKVNMMGPRRGTPGKHSRTGKCLLIPTGRGFRGGGGTEAGHGSLGPLQTVKIDKERWFSSHTPSYQ